MLVVDDDTHMLSVIERMLTGYRVTTARDTLEALAVLATQDRIDVLMTDYPMPSMTGDELVRRAREARPDLQVLVITGYSLAVAAAEPTWSESERHLTKPFGADLLRTTVEELVGPVPP